jgi:hypothetical protein
MVIIDDEINTYVSNINTNTNTNTNTNINININTYQCIDTNLNQINDDQLELEEIKNLYLKIEEIFLNNDKIFNNSYDDSIEFNYYFKKEYAGGFIEYKRTLSSYANTKIDKLIRQIYWRIYEGLVTENINMCYYIIGLEDSGIPSRMSKEELETSIKIISDAMTNVDLKFTYLYLHNTILNYNFVMVKFSLDDKNNNIEYF